MASDNVRTLETENAMSSTAERTEPETTERLLESSATLSYDPATEVDWDTPLDTADQDRKSTRLNSSHVAISYAVFCLKKKSSPRRERTPARPCGATRRRRRVHLRPH